MVFLLQGREWHPFRMHFIEKAGQGALPLADECDAVGIKIRIPIRKDQSPIFIEH